jgi:hypothetical protein
METNPSEQLRQLAHAEAAAFRLPFNWRLQRTTRTGFAIDAPYSRDIDDAVSLTEGDGAQTLHVSISDVGGFIPPRGALATYAQYNGASRYQDEDVIEPMLPSQISERRLSLVHGKARPVITVHIPINGQGEMSTPTVGRDILVAHRVAYRQVESMIDAEPTPAGVALNSLKRVAGLLFMARHHGTTHAAVLEDEEGMLLAGDLTPNPGRLIVQESMIAANALMARFMSENHIPALYRNHGNPDGMSDDYTTSYAVYEPVSRGHAALALPTYLHFTSPIRRFADFVNHANLAAFLEERDYPYPESELDRIGQRLNRISLADRDNSQQAAQPGNQFRADRNRSFFVQPRQLIEKFNDASAGPGDISNALFNVAGNPEDIADIKIRAAQFAAANIHHATPAFDVAIARQHITLRPPTDEEDSRGAELMLVDRQGNAYPYHVKNNALSTSIAHARLIGEIAGVSVRPVVPENKQRETRILREGMYYLSRLADDKRIVLSSQRTIADNGEAHVVVQIVVDGATYVREATESSLRRAFRAASVQLIIEHDLINNPPAIIPPTSHNQPGKNPKDNPVIYLAARQQTAGAEQADFQFIDGTEERQFICTARVTDIDGQTYEVSVAGEGKKEAKRLAAAELLALMVPRPLNKRGDTY